jgi:hypothetical protein
VVVAGAPIGIPESMPNWFAELANPNRFYRFWWFCFYALHVQQLTKNCAKNLYRRQVAFWQWLYF